MFKRLALSFILCGFATACASGPAPVPTGMYPQPQYGLSLPDRVAYSQKDPRWASERMGGSGRTLEAEGCLVTATAMALTNLGFKTSPGDLNKQLKARKGYTGSGLLVWSAISRVTDGGAHAKFYTEVNDEIIQSCMAEGYYPLARFILPSGRTHWAVIIQKSDLGYHMRDPLHTSREPLIFPRGVSGFKAVRCIGRA